MKQLFLKFLVVMEGGRAAPYRIEAPISRRPGRPCRGAP
jgi:hypothetical protein